MNATVDVESSSTLMRLLGPAIYPPSHAKMDVDVDEMNQSVGNMTMFESAHFGGRVSPPLPPPVATTSTSTTIPGAGDIDFSKLESICDAYARARTDLIKREALNGLFASIVVDANDDEGFYSAMEGVGNGSILNGGNCKASKKAVVHVQLSIMEAKVMVDNLSIQMADISVNSDPSSAYTFSLDHFGVDLEGEDVIRFDDESHSNNEASYAETSDHHLSGKYSPDLNLLALNVGPFELHVLDKLGEITATLGHVASIAKPMEEEEDVEKLDKTITISEAPTTVTEEATTPLTVTLICPCASLKLQTTSNKSILIKSTSIDLMHSPSTTTITTTQITAALDSDEPFAVLSSNSNIVSNSVISFSAIARASADTALASFRATLPLSDAEESDIDKEHGGRQTRFRENAHNCESIFEGEVPSVIILADDHLLQELRNVEFVLPKAKGGGGGEKAESGKGGRRATLSALVFNCTQVITILYQREGPEAIALVVDKLRSHTIISDVSGFNQTRVVSDDLTLFEDTTTPTRNDSGDKKMDSGKSNNNSTRRKILDRGIAKIKSARPIFYKTPYSFSTSPSSQTYLSALSSHDNALLVDFERSSNEEGSFHGTLKSMTLRYDVKSRWMQTFINLFQPPTTSPVSESNPSSTTSTTFSSSKTESQKSANSSPSSSKKKPKNKINPRKNVMKLFVNFNDCIVDYLPPASFFPSRLLLQISNIRIASNLVSKAFVQSFKIMVSTSTIHLVNERVPYSFYENSRISCASLLMNKGRRTLKTHPPLSFEEFLAIRGFVSVCSILSIELFASINSKGAELSYQPNISLSIPSGVVRVGCCRDSFQTLSSTFTEWWLIFSQPECNDDLEEGGGPGGGEVGEGGGDDTGTTGGEREVYFDVDFENKPFVMNAQESTVGAFVPARRRFEGGESVLGIIDPHFFSAKNENNLKAFAKKKTLFTTTLSSKPKSSSAVTTTVAPIPDSELSATELRHKHKITPTKSKATSEEAAIDLAKSLLIENYYTISTNGSGSVVATANANQGFENSTASTRKEENPIVIAEEGTTNEEVKIDLSKSWVFEDFPSYTNEKEVANWYDGGADNEGVQIFPQHVSIPTTEHPMTKGDMDAALFAKTETSPHCHMRTIILDAIVTCRLFDGLDFVDCDVMGSARGRGRKGREGGGAGGKKDTLLGALLNDDYDPNGVNPQIEEEEAGSGRGLGIRKKSHRSNVKFFDAHMKGIKLRSDTFEETQKHKLASCLDLNINDIHFSELITTKVLKKTVGEWVNTKLHPRDADDGILMMKLVTFRPTNKYRWVKRESSAPFLCS